MSSGNPLFLTGSVYYPNLIGWVMVVVISMILLVSKGKKMNQHIRIMNYVSIVIAVLMILFLVFLR